MSAKRRKNVSEMVEKHGRWTLVQEFQALAASATESARGPQPPLEPASVLSS
jgi:hypothetical protein